VIGALEGFIGKSTAQSLTSGKITGTTALGCLPHLCGSVTFKRRGEGIGRIGFGVVRGRWGRGGGTRTGTGNIRCGPRKAGRASGREHFLRASAWEADQGWPQPGRGAACCGIGASPMKRRPATLAPPCTPRRSKAISAGHRARLQPSLTRLAVGGLSCLAEGVVPSTPTRGRCFYTRLSPSFIGQGPMPRGGSRLGRSLVGRRPAVASGLPPMKRTPATSAPPAPLCTLRRRSTAISAAHRARCQPSLTRLALGAFSVSPRVSFPPPLPDGSGGPRAPAPSLRFPSPASPSFIGQGPMPRGIREGRPSGRAGACCSIGASPDETNARDLRTPCTSPHPSPVEGHPCRAPRRCQPSLTRLALGAFPVSPRVSFPPPLRDGSVFNPSSPALIGQGPMPQGDRERRPFSRVSACCGIGASPMKGRPATYARALHLPAVRRPSLPHAAPVFSRRSPALLSGPTPARRDGVVPSTPT
jgi:hypothetical protein